MLFKKKADWQKAERRDMHKRFSPIYRVLAAVSVVAMGLMLMLKYLPPKG